MPVDEDFGQRLGRLLTATAALALHVRTPNAWATGSSATKLRDQMDELIELLEDANDAIEKEKP